MMIFPHNIIHNVMSHCAIIHVYIRTIDTVTFISASKLTVGDWTQDFRDQDGLQ